MEYNMSPFQYSDLHVSSDQIRLIKLRAGDVAHPLFAEIITASLKEDLSYSALSYVWGTDAKTYVLATPHGPIPITSSLRSALICLRSSKNDTLLWADAVCINQENNEEKAHQVRLMRTIYEKAERVQAHLGEEADNSQMAYELMLTIGTKDIGKAYGVGPNDHIDGRMLENRCPSGLLPGPKDAAWEALRAILRRPWFQRAWIVQEIALAKDVLVYCGEWHVEWFTLAGVVLQGGNHALPIHMGPRYGKEMSGMAENGQRSIKWLIWVRGGIQQGLKWPLLDLLQAFRHTSSTHARDHLFALIGLAANAEDASFDPDYLQPFEAVVKRYAATFVRMGLGKKMLSSAGLTWESSRFPSWIPDWTKIANRHSLTDEDAVSSVYTAAKGTNMELTITADESILVVRGKIFDMITKVGMSHLEHPEAGATHKPLDPIIDRLKESDSFVATLALYPTGEDVSSVYWRTLIVNKRDYNTEAPEDFTELYSQAREVLRRKHAQDRDFDMDNSIYAAAWPYLGRLLRTFEFMRFCISEKGYMGLSAEATKQGDLICIIHGMQTPYVLRRCDNRPQHFRLVGQCYIHGIMKGEACGLPDLPDTDISLW